MNSRVLKELESRRNSILSAVHARLQGGKRVTKGLLHDLEQADNSIETRKALNYRLRLKSRFRKELREAYPEPDRCANPNCHYQGKLHMHHYGRTWSDLFQEGVADDITQHQIVYLCPECHAAAHLFDSIYPALRTQI